MQTAQHVTSPQTLNQVNVKVQLKKNTKRKNNTFMLACSWAVSENYQPYTALEYLLTGSQMLSILLMEIRHTLCIGQWLRGMTFHWALERRSYTAKNKLDKFWKLWNMFSNFLKNSNTSTDGWTYDGKDWGHVTPPFLFFSSSFLFSIVFFWLTTEQCQLVNAVLTFETLLLCALWCWISY